MKRSIKPELSSTYEKDGPNMDSERSSDMKHYWARMSPEERSAEIRRRRSVTQSKKTTGKRYLSPKALKAISDAQKERWRRVHAIGGGKRTRVGRIGSTRSPFPPEVMFTHDNPTSIRARLEAIEAALAQLKAEIGF